VNRLTSGTQKLSDVDVSSVTLELERIRTIGWEGQHTRGLPGSDAVR
jgi:hypothetical protein